ncbi:splicing factor C9orf78 homolog [Episyrphus balteatus]|uniref:splicing factor C9orf78 homolog n=1 Tax=Episyrphus balteatus TaxID=286459 RepID=UPI002484F7A8|nr:splicing factor C9orf78 homolog [Episyrphus balteatus]
MSDEDKPTELNKIVFKKKPRKNIKLRRRSGDDDETELENPAEILSSLEEIKERQKLRGRPNGVSIAGLALGKKLALEEEITTNDPFNTKCGGMLNMQALKAGKIKEADDAYDVGIGTQFSAETNKRDEDEEMMKYIEEELRKRKGVAKDVEEQEGDKTKYMTPEEAALFALPDHLRQSSSNRSEEMLSNQMLNGIPEVDLGIEAKIKNIEATEEAKQKLVQEQKNKKDGPSVFVPTNMAVNFMQHNRFNIEDAEPRKRKKPVEPVDKTTGTKKATDDYHYDKFKKQFRRF